jgi:hypothetical protein
VWEGAGGGGTYAQTLRDKLLPITIYCWCLKEKVKSIDDFNTSNNFYA